MTSAASSTSGPTIELSPSYTIPVVLLFAGVLMLLVQKWVGLAIAFLGLFLLFQAATIRLQFSETALELYRSEKLIRSFAYQDWLNWRIFWTPVPILFYFKEVKSIHFLPILFDPKMLKTCLEQRCTRI
ncbi:DUF3119 family protein [Lyngbya aestuarii]|uniref:DUF3119 family protein n=1 Tax=Lyngbya aestuarii TaxID=118322 RepID=UPI00403D6CDB